MAETNKKLESNDSKMYELNHKFDLMMDKFFASTDVILGSTPTSSHTIEGSGRKDDGDP